ncbi:AraC family transcriptional regulator [Flavivirga rizhaonensis]|uniref:AraC family transcriptional regulator n=1 Tax=Flavivirga rizhaonensis TaxID=2559571 RepID=A0A4S1DUX7_9FLAO|nr:AraC family transcriptional regulator [Flavivirga rizhaonensis]TGV01847.1 AraC family transcriptional regulator [Flavivirga rizhaonensis]
MKPQLIRVPNKSDFSFYISNEIVPYFYNPFHYHDKLELTYIIKSTGTRFVSNNIDKFKPGELVLVGPNVPHCWKNDSKYFEKNSKLKAQAIVIHFELNFLGEKFRKIPEMNKIDKLFTESRNGILFSSEITKQIKNKLFDIEHLSGAKKIIHFIEILEILSHDAGKLTLSSSSENYSINDKNLVRMNNVINYITTYYKKDLTVQQLSEITHLTPNAFCRYFKKHTRKTFKEFLNELRISNVCKLLRETDLSINEIAYSNGYNSLSHFIKMFKKIKHMKPYEYRKRTSETKALSNPKFN